MVKLILTGIYRRETSIISRLIKSCSSIIDAVCACNTEGVKDDMTEEIEKTASELNLPVKIIHEPWKNFGHNRSLNFKHFQGFVRELNWDPSTTYALLLDADMCLTIGPSFNKNKLKEAMYQLMQKNSVIEYFNVRLIRADIPATCRGVTHEYWEQDESGGWKSLPIGQIRDLEIDDRNDGKYKGEKYSRDIKLLTEGLKEEPENVRYMFYLAQSYKDSGNFKDAIRWYDKRINAGGWAEEIFYSKYMIGNCYTALVDKAQKKGKVDKAHTYYSCSIEAYLEAYDYYPKRSESLHALAMQYRLNGKNKLAYMIAKQGSMIPYPHGDLLFIGKAAYEFLFKLELSIVSFYVPGRRSEGYLLCNELLLDRRIGDSNFRMCHRNMIHYAEPIKIVSRHHIDVKLPLLDDKRPGIGTLRPMNPSLITTKQGYLVNVRCVSYRQTNGVYSYPDGSGIIRTINILAKMDKNLTIIEEKELIDMTEDGKPIDKFPKTVYGLEDIRLFEWDPPGKNTASSLWCTCSTFLTANTPQITLCNINNNKVVSKELLIGPKGEFSCEKNWMPAISNKHLYLIYSHDPLIKLHYNGGNDPKTRVSMSEPVQLPWNLSPLRGSGVLLPLGESIDKGYIAVVHEVALDENRRVYLHRFITYDRKFIPQKLSLPFYFFEKSGVEYVCSAAFDHNKKHLILGLGINDYDAFLVKISIDVVKSMLLDFPKF